MAGLLEAGIGKFYPREAKITQFVKNRNNKIRALIEPHLGAGA
jgi:hypothetical protein